jgi:maltooligosyltrehalose trehalohydrolase
VGVAPHQLVVSAQNHDQIGNRAQGERLSMMLGLPQLKAVAALTVLAPFVPLLFQGEEWGAATPFLYFTDHENPELGRLVAEGRSREFSAFRWQGAVPNPQEADTFARSKLNWPELSEARHAELLRWYREIIRLRRDKAVMTHESPAESDKAVAAFDAEAGWLTFVHNGVLAVFNLAERAQSVPRPSGDWRLVLRSDSNEVQTLDTMAPGSTRIYIGG